MSDRIDESEMEEQVPNEVDEETKGADSRDKVKHNEKSDQFNYIRSLTCFICFISTICKTLRMSVFNKELLTYLLTYLELCR